MKQAVIITGAGGQLGRELQLTAGPGAEFIALGRDELDIGDGASVADCLRSYKPQLIINAAAYTPVDTAESEPALAARGNSEGPAILAAACKKEGCRLLHVSTDFVFDGSSSTPYLPDAATGPLSEYGRSKLAGERAVMETLPSALVLRTGWVYSRFGGNFVKTMLRLMADREELSVVSDQVGTPTWARGLAQALWAAAERADASGFYHWSDAGVCSWYDLAVAIGEEAFELDLLPHRVRVLPITAEQYPTPARRPAYSVLDKTTSWRDFELQPVHWRVQLRAMLQDLKESH